MRCLDFVRRDGLFEIDLVGLMVVFPSNIIHQLTRCCSSKTLLSDVTDFRRRIRCHNINQSTLHLSTFVCVM